MIADLHRDEQTVRQIAKELRRAPSTISREPVRHTDSHGRYRPEMPDRLATERVARPRQRRVSAEEGLRAVAAGLPGCRASGGAQNCSPTSCASSSPPSPRGGCVPSRSTRPSTTHR